MTKEDSGKSTYSKAWHKGKPFTILSQQNGELMVPLVFALPCGDLLVAYADKGDVFFATQELLRSKDGGRTWQEEPLALISCHCVMDLGKGLTRMYSAISFAVRNSSPKQFVFQYSDSADGGKTFGPVQWATYDHDGERYPTIGECYSAWGHYGKEPLNEEAIGIWKDGLVAAGWRAEEWPSAELAYHGPLLNSWLRLPDGSLLNLFQGQTDGQNPSRFVQLFAARSTDNGIHWTHVARLNPNATDAAEGYAEASPVLLNDGRIYAVLRHGGGGWPLMEIWSDDQGKTWSPMHKLDDRVRGVFPVMQRLADGALSLCHGRPCMYLMFDPTGTGAQWEIESRLDLYVGEELTLSANAKPTTVRTDLVNYMSGIAPPFTKADLPWARQDVLNGNFCSLENVNYCEVSPGRILLVYDLQNFIEHPGAPAKKALRGVWITKE